MCLLLHRALGSNALIQSLFKSVESYRAAIVVFYLRLGKHVTKKELHKGIACENQKC